MQALPNLQAFFAALRQEGIGVSIGQAHDCCQALLHVDWSDRDCFYAAMSSSLVKEYSLYPVFDELFQRFFQAGHVITGRTGESLSRNDYNTYDPHLVFNEGSSFAQGVPVNAQDSAQAPPAANNNPLETDFRLASIADVRRMELMFPVVARRLAAKMVKKNQRNSAHQLNFRKTIRQSMGTGGIPLDLSTSQRVRERPVLVILCDVSGSVMTFSSFALALLASMGRFFRQIRSFAFIDEIDDISRLVQTGDPLHLRSHIFRHAHVTGISGHSDYGAVFKAFQSRHHNLLNHKTTLLIFGDARNNWARDEAELLQEMKRRVKKICWFNPEPPQRWNIGDSRMSVYAPHCDAVFACANLIELERALGRL